MEDKKILNDNELENVTGGTGTAIDGSGRDGSSKEGGKDAGKDAGIYAGGDICPLNGKHCKHGMVSLSGKCHHVEERKECTKNGDFTVFICEYINDQE